MKPDQANDAEILFLVHRIPFPPNKGDKIRSFHLLQHLCRSRRVHLGCFADERADMQYVGELEAMCASVCVRPLNPTIAKIKSLAGLADGRALSIPYYGDRELQAWTNRVVATRPIQAAVVFSSPMAQFVMGESYAGLRRIMDFVDVDSDKWQQYGESKKGPARWIYSREARRLASFEEAVAREFDASVFVSENETNTFSERCPGTSSKHFAIRNGVATDFFDPAESSASPYPADAQVVVLTGAMDYWPNADAAQWFAGSVFPQIRATVARAEFWIVGSSPGPAVRSLAEAPGIHVTGRVDDIRPYLKHASVAVAPLRVARGVQNKVLEALAMDVPVVCTPQAAAGLTSSVRDGVRIAADTQQLYDAVSGLLLDTQRDAGACRALILRDYDWAANLGRFDELIAAPRPQGRA